MATSWSSQRETESELTVVIPVYKNAASLRELHHRLCRVCGDRSDSYEIIFVNDASPDGSMAVLNDLSQMDSKTSVITLERNLGQHKAVMIGLAEARGKSVVVMDADLQDPPEALPFLLNKLDEGYACVFAGRRGRYESSARMITSRLFKLALHKLCGIPADAGMYFAASQEMITRLLAFNTSSPYVVGMIGCSGLSVTSTPVVRHSHPEGSSSIGWRKRFQIAGQAIIWVFMWKGRHRSRVSDSKPV